MDMYKIICPYCKHKHVPPLSEKESSSTYRTMICDACGKPFVNHNTWAPVYVSFALVGVEQPDEPMETTVEWGPENPVIDAPGHWYRGPGKLTMYSITPTHVYISNQLCNPVRLSWGAVEYLLAHTGEYRVWEISKTLGENAQVRQKLGVAMFLKALENDKIPHDRISHYRQMIE